MMFICNMMVCDCHTIVRDLERHCYDVRDPCDSFTTFTKEVGELANREKEHGLHEECGDDEYQKDSEERSDVHAQPKGYSAAHSAP